MDGRAFVRVNTVLRPANFVPELILHQADQALPLWEATEAELDRRDMAPPFWAFAWAGGQGLARYVLDNPALVAGRWVLDLAAGGGIVGLAALRAGAARVDFNDIDPLAGAAIQLNAEANDLISGYTLILSDLLGEQSGVGSGARSSLRSSRGKWDVVLTGDICYERDMAALMLAWLRDRSGESALALIAYDVPTDLDLEDSTQRRTHVLRVDPV